ncbi:MAG: hypothetical protein E7G34_24615 [Klebsiella pneumoniae]|nr:hypothetical protein [Klebsiella pneumoniae]
MDTGILHLPGRSCHHNKSQRGDPFVCLTRIIADKTKLVEDLSGARSCAKPDMARAEGRFKVFGRIGVMPGKIASEKIDKEAGRQAVCYAKFGR